MKITITWRFSAQLLAIRTSALYITNLIVLQLTVKPEFMENLNWQNFGEKCEESLVNEIPAI